MGGDQVWGEIFGGRREEDQGREDPPSSSPADRPVQAEAGILLSGRRPEPGTLTTKVSRGWRQEVPEEAVEEEWEAEDSDEEQEGADTGDTEMAAPDGTAGGEWILIGDEEDDLLTD